MRVISRSAEQAETPAAPPTQLDFASYVNSRLPHLIKFGFALTTDEHAAADLVQDALERALVKWPRISDNPEPYIRRTMVNRRISLWRKFGAERTTDRLPELPTVDPGHDVALFAALRQLPPKQRAVIALRYLEDLTEPETAAVLGCAVGTVKSQSSSALAKLRVLLGEEVS
jgi:RNA polymerase sigma-70 factor (sigma-E family)